MDNNQPPDNTDPLKGLTTRERKFVVLYCQYQNAARAAREAGYSAKSAKQIGHENLTNPYLLTAISAVMDQYGMPVGECIGRLTKWGRGSLRPFVTETGEVTLTTEEAQDNLELLKKVKYRKETRTDEFGTTETTFIEIELHDPKDAVDKMMQVHGRYKQVPGDAGGKPRAVYTLPDGTTLEF